MTLRVIDDLAGLERSGLYGLDLIVGYVARGNLAGIGVGRVYLGHARD